MNDKIDLIYYDINATDSEIKLSSAKRKLERLRKLQKHYKKWAIIPPLLTFLLCIGGNIYFALSTKSLFNLSQFLTLNLTFIFPGLIVSIYPIIYSKLIKENDINIEELENEINVLEDVIKLEKENKKQIEFNNKEDVSKIHMLESLYESKKDIFNKLYKSGNLDSCLDIGLSIEDINYIMCLIDVDKAKEEEKEMIRTRKR